MKKAKTKDLFLAELKRVPIVQVACEKTNLSRNTIYRWKKEDENFHKEMELALAEGEALVNDMTESQLLVLIREKNWPAMSFWLKHRNPKFRERIEVTTVSEDDDLSPEQEALVKKALELGSIIKTNGKK
jgi:predicted DNA binding protein